MKNNKKPTGAEYYDNYYNSYNQKQYYSNTTREQELHSFTKNQAFELSYNSNNKGKPKRQDQKNLNNKRNDDYFFERKNNENMLSNVQFKSNKNIQANEMTNSNANKGPNQASNSDIYFNNGYQHNNAKALKNNQTSQNKQENQVFQNQHYHKQQNNNSNQFNKGSHNKRYQHKNYNYNSHNSQEKDSLVNKQGTEIPRAPINSSDKRFDLGSECNFEFTDVNNFKNKNTSCENNFNPESKLELALSSQNDQNTKDNSSANSSTQVDSYNSVGDKITLENADQSTLNEKKYTEDNTKTNTDSNTPASASPVLAFHRKSINSIKNDLKLNNSSDNNDKCFENLDTADLNTKRRTAEPNIIISNNESGKFNTTQLTGDENVQINDFRANDIQNKFNSQSKLNFNSGSRSSMSSSISGLKLSDNSLGFFNNMHSSNANKNSDLFNKNKFSQNLNFGANRNYIQAAPIVDSYPQANLRTPPFNNLNYNKNKQPDFNQLPPQQSLPLFSNANPNMFLQNNPQFANQNHFQTYPQLFNRNFELLNSISFPNNKPVYLNNGLNNIQQQNEDYIGNMNANYLVPPNHQKDSVSFPAFNRCVNNNNNLFLNNFQHNYNIKNNINTSHNFFLDNFQRPFANKINNGNITHTDSINYQRPSIVNTNFPQKNRIVENKANDSVTNPESQKMNNYFNYLFNYENANDSILAKDMKPESKLTHKENDNLPNSKVIEILSEEKIKTKEKVKMSSCSSIVPEQLDNKYQKKSNIVPKPEENQCLITVSNSIAETNTSHNKKQNHNNLREPKDFVVTKAVNQQELDGRFKTNKPLKTHQNKKSDHFNSSNPNEKYAASAKIDDDGSPIVENAEILKVVLLNVPGTESVESNLTFSIHKHDNLFESFKSFLTLNKISLNFEFPILVNIFQALSTIYNLSNSKVSKKDERSLKVLHSIWKNHCFLVSQKTIFNRKNHTSSLIQKNLEHELDKMLNLNLNKDLDLPENSNDIANDVNNENVETDKNLIERVGVYNSSFLSEDSIEPFEEDPELDVCRSFSFAGEHECNERMHYMNNMSLLNKSF